MCFPFLATRESLVSQEPLVVGPWKVVSLAKAVESETWASAQFKASVEAMLGLFRYGPLGTSVKNPTVVSRVDDGMTGEPPTTDQRNALTATVAFCALDTNRSQVSGRFDSRIVAEHLDYWEFPVSADGCLSLPLGRRVKTLHNANWTEKQPIIGPTVISSMIPHVQMNQATASMLHEALMIDSADSKRLRTAIQFLVESWRNHSSVVGLSDWQFEPGAIICDQQTAFEALLDIRGTRDGPAKVQIVRKFQEVIDQVKAIDPVVGQCSDCLWGEHTQEQLEQWATTFTQRRNKTIHQGDALAGLPDETEPWPLLREVVDTADQLLRDAIRARAALISELPPGDALQDALPSPSNNDYRLMLAFTRGLAAASAAVHEDKSS